MTIRILSFTEAGAATAERAARAWPDDPVINSRFSDLGMSLKEYTDGAFSDADALVFVGACGIAVRAIAPFVRSKLTDPAVLVVDESAHFVIPILSGHIGGANALASHLAAHLGAEAVITTATDIRKKFAVDTFAVKNHLRILDPAGIKLISSAILAGEKIGFFCELPMDADLPEELVLDEPKRLNIVIPDTGRISGEKLQAMIRRARDPGTAVTGMMVLLPERAVLGVGCRKGEKPEKVRSAALAALSDAKTDPEELCAIASVDQKKDEPALRQLAKDFGVRVLTYPASLLDEVPGSFEDSSFVRETVGTGNVAGRSSVLAASRLGKSCAVLLPKHVYGGVTCAVASFARKRILF